MNVFRLAGDMTHLLSIILLLLKIRTMKSCAGISLKTQELYVIVFATRYLDLFTNYVSFYNTVMKLVFLGTSVSIVWYMRYHKVVRQTYNRDEDAFRHFFLVLPCALLALMINHAFTVTEVLWTFSLYLEAVSILPQLVLLQKSRNIDNLTGNYVFLLGLGVRLDSDSTLRRLLLLLYKKLEKSSEVKASCLKGTSSKLQTASNFDESSEIIRPPQRFVNLYNQDCNLCDPGNVFNL
ncbi:ER lumen protein-retaining receptor-like isoform X1 [Tasmannia lanceolata]|uniref:ER lumen protein-retaining receptor-like isoform X1 n=1 Tax=Tasmannia lanceolata TaxID=3420 RepID=UPI004064A039